MKIKKAIIDYFFNEYNDYSNIDKKRIHNSISLSFLGLISSFFIIFTGFITTNPFKDFSFYIMIPTFFIFLINLICYKLKKHWIAVYNTMLVVVVVIIYSFIKDFDYVLIVLCLGAIIGLSLTYSNKLQMIVIGSFVMIVVLSKSIIVLYNYFSNKTPNFDIFSFILINVICGVILNIWMIAYKSFQNELELLEKYRLEKEKADIANTLVLKLKDINLELDGNLKEKELILKEVHHRIKNNMNAIISLLGLKARSIKDNVSKNILYETIGRIKSMAILYNKLYKSNNYQKINAKEYLEPLVNDMLGVLPSIRAIKTTVETDDFSINSEFLLPLGIIINELITNSVKYAFKGKMEALISIITKKNNDEITLIYSDNGIGLPESITLENSTGFGMQLINMLVKQLDGLITIDRSNGTTFSIKFKI